MTGLGVPSLDLEDGAAAPQPARAGATGSRRRAHRPGATSTAVLVEQAAAVGVASLRLSLVVQMVPALGAGMQVSARPREYVALWTVAVVVAVLGAAGVAVRRRPLAPGVVYADVAVAAVLLVVTGAAVPVEHRIGSWVGWTAGYALTVACSAGTLRSLRGWLLSIGVIVGGYLVYVGPLAAGPALPTVIANALGYVVLAGTVRLIVWYLRRISRIADHAQAEVARLARLEEEHRAQLAMHDATTVMQLLSDPTLPVELRAQLQTQAVAEVRRMRSYLRRETLPVLPTAGAPGLTTNLRNVVADACDGFSDLGPQVRTDLLADVEVAAASANALVGALRTVLHNVRQHADATAVVVHGDAEPDGVGARRWTITVNDDGRGFDVARTPLGVGLRTQVVEELALHDVDVRLASEPGCGTRVELSGTVAA
ncbi:MAG: sensor histidine kinase [Janthinobacterium lividum]